MDFVHALKDRIDAAYREQVIAAANGADLNLDQTVAVLAHIQRSPEQLAADVNRLRDRRRLAERLGELASLDQDVAKALQEYQRTDRLKRAAHDRLDQASSEHTRKKSVDTQLALNRGKHAVADAATRRMSSFKALEAAKRRRDLLKQEVLGGLETTALDGSDPTTAENFAFT